MYIDIYIYIYVYICICIYIYRYIINNYKFIFYETKFNRPTNNINN